MSTLGQSKKSRNCHHEERSDEVISQFSAQIDGIASLPLVARNGIYDFLDSLDSKSKAYQIIVKLISKRIKHDVRLSVSCTSFLD